MGFAQTDSKMTGANDDTDIVVMELKDGVVIIQLYPDKAPRHVQRIKELIREKFYDGLTFHRVIPGFMAQTGDPKGNGTGKSDKPNLGAEFNDIKHVRGVLSMARSTDKDSANSQFFIMLGDAEYLDGQYTAFGRVLSGMEFVDQVKQGSKINDGVVDSPDHIISMKLGGNLNQSYTRISSQNEGTATPEPALA